MSLERLLEAGRELESSAPALPAPRDPRWAAVLAALRALPPAERRVVAFSFGRSYTLREIGSILGLSESGACRLRTRALARLRAALE